MEFYCKFVKRMYKFSVVAKGFQNLVSIRAAFTLISIENLIKTDKCLDLRTDIKGKSTTKTRSYFNTI